MHGRGAGSQFVGPRAAISERGAEEPKGGPETDVEFLHLVPAREATPAVGGNELRACRLTLPCFDSARADRTCAFLRKRVRITRLQNPYTRCSETAKGYRLGQSAGSLDTPTHSGLLWEGRVKFP